MEIDLSVQNALQFIKAEQQESGIFYSVSGAALNCTNELLEDFSIGEARGWTSIDQFSIFPTMLIGNALKNVNYRGVFDVVLNQIDNFLLKERHNLFWVWNHFNKNHRLFKMNPYDVDSTAIALEYLRDRGKISSQAEKRTLALFKDQLNSEGLFFTFFTFRGSLKCSWKSWMLFLRELKSPISTRIFWKRVEADRMDVDGIVNVNVLHYLGRIPECEKLVFYLKQELECGNELKFDKWYKSYSVIYYFVSRLNERNYPEFESVFSRWRQELMNFVESPDFNKEHELDVALYAVSMINLKMDRTYILPCIQHLIQNQQVSGSWRKKVFYFGGPKKIMGWGSEALTTAICLEALMKFKIEYQN
jgi:hypothetical protein